MEIKIHTENTGFVWLHRVMDATTPILMLAMLFYLLPYKWHDRYLTMGAFGSLIFVTSAQIFGVYQSWRSRSVFSSTQHIIKAWLMTWAILIILAFLYKGSANYSRLITTTWAVVTPIALVGYRVLIKLLLTQHIISGQHARPIAILGAGKVGQRLAEVLEKNKWLGYKVTAFYDDNRLLHGTLINGIPVVGTTEDVCSACQTHQFQEVYIALPLRAEQKIKDLLNKISDSATIVKFVPDIFTFDLMHAKFIEINGIPIVSVYDTPLYSLTSKLIKRTEDIVLSSMILLLLSPVYLIIALAVKLTSPGPVIFKQQRYGLNGDPIKVYKFRSMSTQDNGPVVKQATKNDPRTTSIGAFLRKTSLDELPQFFNVIQGRMSIVGPRPHAVAHNEEYRKLVPKYMQRHLVKPGITGWAQINGWRGETDTLEKMEKRVEFDLHYINNWSLWFDLKIILLTALKGFINKNAY